MTDTLGQQAGGGLGAAAASGASSLAPPTFPWPAGFPPSQQAALNQMAQQGQLSGVPPQFIAYIEEAETGGWSGGGQNSAGAGGYFGLFPNQQYPGGSVNADELNSGGATDNPSFRAQATIAASLFAKLLQDHGGNVFAAENAYQTGNASTAGNGSAIFAQYLPGNTTFTPGGNPGTAGTKGATLTSGPGGTQDPTKCVVGFGGLFGLGSFCILNAQQARAVEGYLIMIGGTIPIVLGFVGLLAVGFGRTGPAQALSAVPGPVGAVAGVSRRAAGGAPARRRTSNRVERRARATAAPAEPDADEELYQRTVADERAERARTGLSKGERARRAMGEGTVHEGARPRPPRRQPRRERIIGDDERAARRGPVGEESMF